MNIFVGGSARDVPRQAERFGDLVTALGEEIVKQGHTLLNGCQSSLDHDIATAASQWLEHHGGNPKERIVSYCLRNASQIHEIGTVRNSALDDWQMNHSELEIPEQIAQATVTIFLGGGQGTFWAKNWAAFARTLIVGIPRFGGAGEAIYTHELKRLQETAPAMAKDYEALNSLTSDMAEYAHDIVQTVERLTTSRSVFTIMSFKREFRDVFSSCKEVCQEFDFEAERPDESASLDRIIPRIETGLRRSAFVIADVSEPSANVFYEIGYARGLGKDVVITARTGTPLPFDLGDVPTVFWEIQEDLKAGLRTRLAGLTTKFGR